MRTQGRWLLAASVWLALLTWLRPLALPDEGRYVGVAQEMLHSGDWITPTLNGLPFFHKPPLFYWLTGASLAAFGLHEWAARLAPLAGAMLGLAALAALTARWAEDAAPRVALALAVHPLWYLGAQYANLDMLVAGCITATTCALAHAVLSAEAARPHRHAVLLAWVGAALGVLAKGLIGFVLPGAVVFVWLIATGRWRHIPALLWWPGPLVFALLVAPWFWLMEARHAGFLHYFFMVQHVQRFAESGFNNPQPWWFYPAVLAGASLAGWAGIAAALRTRGPLTALMLCWAAGVTLFFSLPASKLLGYILPAVPPLAWLIGAGFAARAGRPAWRRAGWAGAVLSAAAGVVVVAVVAHQARASVQQLALALAAQQRPGDAVLMLREYHFDLPFYAPQARPIRIVDDWDDPALHREDNWRKAFAEALEFATPAQARALVTPAQLPAVLCEAPRAWVFASDAALQATPALSGARLVQRQGQTGLWVWEGACGAGVPTPQPAPLASPPRGLAPP